MMSLFKSNQERKSEHFLTSNLYQAVALVCMGCPCVSIEDDEMSSRMKFFKFEKNENLDFALQQWESHQCHDLTKILDVNKSLKKMIRESDY